MTRCVRTCEWDLINVNIYVLIEIFWLHFMWNKITDLFNDAEDIFHMFFIHVNHKNVNGKCRDLIEGITNTKEGLVDELCWKAFNKSF
jgi:hypothetical protein